jgi:hypothetical protein
MGQGISIRWGGSLVAPPRAFSFFPRLRFDLLYLFFDSFACPPGRKWLELISIRKLGFVISYCTFNLPSNKGSSCVPEIRVGQDGTS